MAKYEIKDGVGIIPGVGIKTIEEKAFEGCTALKTINVPAKKADYYKERLPEELHHLIVELPVKK